MSAIFLVTHWCFLYVLSSLYKLPCSRVLLTRGSDLFWVLAIAYAMNFRPHVSKIINASSVKDPVTFNSYYSFRAVTRSPPVRTTFLLPAAWLGIRSRNVIFSCEIFLNVIFTHFTFRPHLVSMVSFNRVEVTSQPMPTNLLTKLGTRNWCYWISGSWSERRECLARENEGLCLRRHGAIRVRWQYWQTSWYSSYYLLTQHAYFESLPLLAISQFSRVAPKWSRYNNMTRLLVNNLYFQSLLFQVKSFSFPATTRSVIRTPTQEQCCCLDQMCIRIMKQEFGEFVRLNADRRTCKQLLYARFSTERLFKTCFFRQFL